MRIFTGIVLALLVVQASAVADPADKTDATLAQLHTAAKCEDKASVWRVWCIAADYNKGQVPDLPSKNLVGLSIAMTFGGDAGRELVNSVSPSVLAVDKSGKVKLTMIKPTNKDEEKMTFEAVSSMAVFFKGKSPSAKLPKDLVDFVGTLKGTYATTKGKTEWTWKGATPSAMRKVGDAWVVLERPADGIILTILTDHWE